MKRKRARRPPASAGITRTSVLLVTAALVIGLGAAAWWWRDELDAALGGAGGSSRGRPPPQVELARAEQRLITREVPATGTLVAPERVIVTPERAGRVVEIRFSEGQRVEAGEVLVVLDDERQRARLAEARAQLDEAERDFARQEQLVARNNSSEAELDRARTALAAARSAVQIARENLNDRRIEAPFAGRAGRREISPGALLEPGQRITTLVVEDPLDVTFDVPGNLLALVTAEARVRVHSPAYPEQEYEGEVSFVGAEVEAATRSLPVEASIPNPSGDLKPGMFVDVALIADERRALTVPEAAVLHLGPASYVYAIDAENIAHRQPVTPGLRREGWVEIVRGIDPGARVVVTGLQAVRDGGPVRIASAAGTDDSSAADAAP